MSTTSTNFSLVLATTADTVNVVTQIANNFSSLDSILAVVHTGTGSIKSGITITQPTLVSPTISGSIGGSFSITAATGQFNTVTATGGLVTLNSFTIGTYAFPTTIGSANQVLAVQTGNAVWVSNPGGTGAGQALDNLTTVAINTSLNTFTAGFVTVNRIISTSGALTGLTAFQATAGTFAGNVRVAATINADILNVTGGAITAGSLAIGTWSLPATVGTPGQVLTVSSGNGIWSTGAGLKLVSVTPLATTVNSGPILISNTGKYLMVGHIYLVGDASEGLPILKFNNAGTSYQTIAYGIPVGTTAASFVASISTGVLLGPTMTGTTGGADGVYGLDFSLNIGPQGLNSDPILVHSPVFGQSIVQASSGGFAVYTVVGRGYGSIGLANTAVHLVCSTLMSGYAYLYRYQTV